MRNNRLLYIITLLVGFATLLSSCVNDLESIQKVTYDPKAPDEVTKNLRVFYTDSGYARVEVFATLAETYSKPESITKLKDGIKVNFFSVDGKIVSTLTALYGEINNTKGTMFVRDSVQLVNYEKKQRMETEALFWNQKDSAIYTTSNVIVRSPDGIVYGDGIRTKQDFSSYEFLKPHGRINMGKK
ncbi:MAG: LPS export ABC transporter periplasmic protein LptC [Crocinitomicaceae bacterium]|nr:MAG: LPS export ABC transporter periplasmic protein LptC [Crocinitomicaceae bacterium]